MTMSGGQRRSARRSIGSHRMGATESLSCASGTTHFNPNTYRAFWRSNRSIHEHTVHHTKANITNSLLQDITVFNEYSSTKLEEWLTNLETTADLTNES